MPALVRRTHALQAHRSLAAAVIQQALDDIANENVDSLVRAEARDFLADSQALKLWCSVAGVAVSQVEAALAHA